MTRSGARSSFLLALLLVLAACTPGAEPDPTASPDDSATAAPTPTEAVALQATQVAAGDQHACALLPDGSAWCWGYNFRGQLGNGSNASSVRPVAVLGDHTFVSLSAGRYFTCGLEASGAAWCWGDNSRGQLGNGRTGEGSSRENTAEPVQVQGGLAFDELTTGQLHACGLVAGDAFCWGAYASGQLGNGAGSDQVRPGRSAEDLVLTTIVASGTNTCGLDASGAAWCWGSNNFGQLGNGTTSNARQPVPTKVDTDVAFEALTVGSADTCGLDADGAAWCWGRNDAGQVGDGTNTERPVPTKVAGGQVLTAIESGTRHTCAIDTDGAALCWGANGTAQLGDGSRNDAPTPVSVRGGHTFTQLAPGEEFTCGIAEESVVHCWGSNRAGWLGDGTLATRSEPTPVLPATSD